jgi:cytochrome c-type biogenesis protein CcmF
MVVHLGVVLIAVAYAASHSFAHQAPLTLAPGQSASFEGHSFTYVANRQVITSTHTATEYLIRVDGSKVYAPAISFYPYAQDAIGTPSVDSSAGHDIYLSLASTPATPQSDVVVTVIVEPLVSWIWIGGAVMLAGTALAAWPGGRRRSPSRPNPARAPVERSEELAAAR